MPRDADGDGRISDSGAERIPELISAVGDNGVEGFIRRTDLWGTLPSNPDEALRRASEVRVIPVYADDGTTVVDHLTERGGPPSEEGGD